MPKARREHDLKDEEDSDLSAEAADSPAATNKGDVQGIELPSDRETSEDSVDEQGAGEEPNEENQGAGTFDFC